MSQYGIINDVANEAYDSVRLLTNDIPKNMAKQFDSAITIAAINASAFEIDFLGGKTIFGQAALKTILNSQAGNFLLYRAGIALITRSAVYVLKAWKETFNTQLN
uniref:Uncharacterized protein n=1 Tax=Panagrolaimus davidi TaxID=227884 RepID=A0A914PIQ6_9BILA